MRTIGEIEKARQRLGVKPSTLSTAAGFSPSAYGKVLRGKFAFRERSLKALTEALEVIEARFEADKRRLARIGTAEERKETASRMAKSKVYTRGGDAGETSMLSGERVSKADAHIASVGDLDELSVALGFARLAHPKRRDLLKAAQKNLYQLSAMISYAGDKDIDRFKLEPGAVKALEALIDEIQNDLPPLKEFIYPGQTEAGCRLHQARVLARRVERGLTHLPAQKSAAAIPYINRLSDLLFVLAREADHLSGAREEGYRGEDRK